MPGKTKTCVYAWHMDQKEEFETVAVPMEAGETFEQRLANTKQKYEGLGWTFVEIVTAANYPGVALFRGPRSQVQPLLNL